MGSGDPFGCMVRRSGRSIRHSREPGVQRVAKFGSSRVNEPTGDLCVFQHDCVGVGNGYFGDGGIANEYRNFVSIRVAMCRFGSAASPEVGHECGKHAPVLVGDDDNGSLGVEPVGVGDIGSKCESLGRSPASSQPWREAFIMAASGLA